VGGGGEGGGGGGGDGKEAGDIIIGPGELHFKIIPSIFFFFIKCKLGANSPVPLALPPPAFPPPAPPPPRWPPPTLCFTGLSLPPPPKTLQKEREPMGLHQKGNESEMTSKKKK